MRKWLCIFLACQLTRCAPALQVAQYDLTVQDEKAGFSIAFDDSHSLATAQVVNLPDVYGESYTGIVVEINPQEELVSFEDFAMAWRGQIFQPLLAQFSDRRFPKIKDPNGDAKVAFLVIFLVLLFLVLIVALAKEGNSGRFHPNFNVSGRSGSSECCATIRATLFNQLPIGTRGYGFLIFPAISGLDESAVLEFRPMPNDD